LAKTGIFFFVLAWESMQKQNSVGRIILYAAVGFLLGTPKLFGAIYYYHKAREVFTLQK
jgi:hypothetical protein